MSRVLNDSTAVSEETRQRVLSAIAELDYAPSRLAQGLSLGRTHSIGVTLPFLTYPSFVERLRGVQHALMESPYDLVLYSTDTTDRRDEHFSLLTRKSRADGVLIMSIPLMEHHVESFLSSAVPIVLVDIFDARLSRVFVDDVEGGYLAARHLLDRGHTRIAYISDEFYSDFQFLAARQRFKGYRQALREAGVVFNPRYHRQLEHDREAGRKAALELLGLEEPPTAIFAASDTQAIGVLDAVKELGLRVPEDVSVMGYDDIRDAEYLDLTTIRQPLYESGLESVKLLLALIENPTREPQEVRLPIELVSRGTVAAPGRKQRKRR